ncbi:hypothetical protein L917_08334 [Phytophthora nicotianae]|uniref:Uncharacterized protein n=2 Tax=Phytophthora nicotianae TaxID=4792 RepID=W2L9P6_PHYNI|nr:hypothetical protein L917_08334 [Phytophthora nicotianae]ETO75725.1 hypothetical protein F444_08727 [Phytophthora nicotianae P1976]
MGCRPLRSCPRVERSTLKKRSTANEAVPSFSCIKTAPLLEPLHKRVRLGFFTTIVRGTVHLEKRTKSPFLRRGEAGSISFEHKDAPRLKVWAVNDVCSRPID